MSHASTIVRGSVAAFWIDERGLVVLLDVAEGKHLQIHVPSWRPDFVGQVELVKYALSVSDDRAARAANGFDAMPKKEVWARVAETPADRSATEGSNTLTIASALGIAAAGEAPFAGSRIWT